MVPTVVVPLTHRHTYVEAAADLFDAYRVAR